MNKRRLIGHIAVGGIHFLYSFDWNEHHFEVERVHPLRVELFYLNFNTDRTWELEWGVPYAVRRLGAWLAGVRS